MATTKEGVFAAGDVVLGPATVIEAIAGGRKAAAAIDKFLGGSGDISETLAPVEDVPLRVDGPREAFRPEIPAISVEKRVTTFEGVELSISEQLAVEEAKRCLRCDIMYAPTTYQVDLRKCIFCGLCVESCPFDAVFLGYGYENAVYRINDLILQKEDIQVYEKVTPSGYFHPEIAEKLPEQTLLLNRDKVIE